MNNIYDAIKQKTGKITFKELRKKFDIGEEELHNLLLELKLDGKIIQIGNKYGVFPLDNFIGSISVTASGRKYVFSDKGMIPLAIDYVGDVILNDTVSFKITDDGHAEVTSVIQRTLGKMTCEVMNIDGKKKIVPYHSEINFSLPLEITKDLLDGDIILVSVGINEIGEDCNVEFIKKLGINRNDPNKREILTAINYGFDNDYSEEFLEELKSYPTSVSEDEIIGRHDFRWQKSFTIDGVNTKDMDDGVYGEKLDNGNIRVYVHISDVSHYVKPGSLVFERACDRTTSAYIGDSAIHMLHHVISNGICSLNPTEDRLTKTVIMDINEEGEIVSFDIVKSAIRSSKKMNYDCVDEVLVSDKIPDGYLEFIPTLKILNEAAMRLENNFLNVGGKIDFANNELDPKYNSDGSIHEIKNMSDGPARKLIEYLMLAANKTVATWLYWSSIPSVYRIHDIPDLNKVNEAINIINTSGFKLRNISDVQSPKVIQKILMKLSRTDEYPVLSQVLVQCMQRACYSTENIGHYALGFEAYTHFTSPIRRLPDLLVHMIVDLILATPEKIEQIDFSEMEKGLRMLCERSSVMERQADLASRDMENTLVIEKLAKLTDEEFEVFVCEIGKKIRVKLYGVDCFIDKDNLSENFGYDKLRKLYYDRNNGRYIRLGAKLLVNIRSVNISNRNVRLSVVGVLSDKIKKKIK